jgi:uncharacterized protein YlzI (FlbEa/FlbD family)
MKNYNKKYQAVKGLHTSFKKDLDNLSNRLQTNFNSISDDIDKTEYKKIQDEIKELEKTFRSLDVQYESLSAIINDKSVENMKAMRDKTLKFETLKKAIAKSGLINVVQKLMLVNKELKTIQNEFKTAASQVTHLYAQAKPNLEEISNKTEALENELLEKEILEAASAKSSVENTKNDFQKLLNSYIDEYQPDQTEITTYIDKISLLLKEKTPHPELTELKNLIAYNNAINEATIKATQRFQGKSQKELLESFNKDLAYYKKEVDKRDMVKDAIALAICASEIKNQDPKFDMNEALKSVKIRDVTKELKYNITAINQMDDIKVSDTQKLAMSNLQNKKNIFNRAFEIIKHKTLGDFKMEALPHESNKIEMGQSNKPELTMLLNLNYFQQLSLKQQQQLINELKQAGNVYLFGNSNVTLKEKLAAQHQLESAGVSINSNFIKTQLPPNKVIQEAAKKLHLDQNKIKMIDASYSLSQAKEFKQVSDFLSQHEKSTQRASFVNFQGKQITLPPLPQTPSEQGKKFVMPPLPTPPGIKSKG